MAKNDKSGRSRIVQVMGLVRLFNRQQVIDFYGITSEIEDEFFSECPTVCHTEGEPSKGTPIYRESDVDEYVRHFRAPPYIHPSRRRGGCPSASSEIVSLAVSLRDAKKTWKEIAKGVNDAFPPADGKKRSAESMRKLVKRQSPPTTRTSGRTDASRRRPKPLIDLIHPEARNHERKD